MLKQLHAQNIDTEPMWNYTKLVNEHYASISKVLTVRKEILVPSKRITVGNCGCGRQQEQDPQDWHGRVLAYIRSLSLCELTSAWLLSYINKQLLQDLAQKRRTALQHYLRVFSMHALWTLHPTLSRYLERQASRKAAITKDHKPD